MEKAQTVFKVLILLFPFMLSASPALGDGAGVADIVVTNTRDHLLVYFTVENCFSPELNQAIENGISTTFTFFVELYEKS